MSRKITPNVPRDPWVVESARRSALKTAQEKENRLRQRQSGWERQERRFTRERNARDRFLMFLFFALAVAVYIGGRAAAPRVIVTLEQGQGAVIVDDQVVGRTGEVIKGIKVGKHQITVKPDDPRVQLVPPQVIDRTISWGLNSTDIIFPVRVVLGAPDTTKVPDP